VERDDREPAARTEDPHRGLEAAREVAELVVDRHPQGLEHAGRGVDLRAPPHLHAGDEPPEFVGADEGAAGPAANDRPCDAGGLGLFAELGEDPPEVTLVPSVHDVRRRESKARVGPHVEGAGRAEAEAPGRIGQLDRRESEVEKDAVDPDEIVLTCDIVEDREVGVDEDDATAEARQLPSRDRESRRVDVEAEKAAIRRGAVEESGCVSPTTDRAVEEAATFTRSKLGEYLGQENRLMNPPIARSRGQRDCR
jgi:hypothetical protein